MYPLVTHTTPTVKTSVYFPPAMQSHLDPRQSNKHACSSCNPKGQAPDDKITHNGEGHDGQVQGLYPKVISKGNHYPQDWQDKEVCSQGGESISIRKNVVHLPEILDFLSAQNQQYMNKTKKTSTQRLQTQTLSTLHLHLQHTHTQNESEKLHSRSTIENRDKTLQNS